MFFMYLGNLVLVYSFVHDGLASGVGGWRVCVVKVCGQLDGCGWFWSVCSFGMNVGGCGVCVVGGVWVVTGV